MDWPLLRHIVRSTGHLGSYKHLVAFEKTSWHCIALITIEANFASFEKKLLLNRLFMTYSFLSVKTFCL